MAKLTFAAGTIEPSSKLTDAAPRRARSRVVSTAAAPGGQGFTAAASAITMSEALEQSAATSAAVVAYATIAPLGVLARQTSRKQRKRSSIGWRGRGESGEAMITGLTTSTAISA